MEEQNKYWTWDSGLLVWHTAQPAQSFVIGKLRWDTNTNQHSWTVYTNYYLGTKPADGEWFDTEKQAYRDMFRYLRECLRENERSLVRHLEEIVHTRRALRD